MGSYDVNQLAGHACAMIERGISQKGRFNIHPTDAVAIVLRTFGLVEDAVKAIEDGGTYQSITHPDLEAITKRANKAADQREIDEQLAEQKLIEAALNRR